MDIREFGTQLIRTQDLDPVYSGLYRAKLPEPQLARALIAYWCFYHLGVAAYLSEYEGSDFWDFMTTAARNDDPDMAPKVILGMNAGNTHDRWPRSTERRHFRGVKCVQTIDFLRREKPEYWARSLTGATTENEVMRAVCTWPLFGPWIAFKVADMMERVYGQPLKFDPNIGLMYDSPRKALDLLAADKEFIAVDKTPEGLYRDLLMFFHPHKAPPANDRWCNAQEVETILCKWGSMKTGHYHVGKDIIEVRHALGRWGETAQQILRVMPEVV